MSTLVLLVLRLAVLSGSKVYLPLLLLFEVHPDNLSAHDARVNEPVLECQAFWALQNNQLIQKFSLSKLIPGLLSQKTSCTIKGEGVVQ